MRTVSVVTLLLAATSASAFLNFGKPAAPKAAPAKPAAPAKQSAPVAPVTGYVPDGLTRAQYAEILAAEAAKKAQRKPKKAVETLDEWQFEFEAGKTGHRFAKMKDNSWYKR